MSGTVIVPDERPVIAIYFSDFFGVDPEDLEAYGAFNVSLINDLPLFIDPFLLFNSKKPEYRALHDDMMTYLRFLRDKAAIGQIDDGLLEAWFTFREVKQNWLGFSKVGNSGSGLWMHFARAMHANLHTVFADFGNEKVTKGSHMEKLTLIRGGVGRDNISDFTTTLIKRYLLDYTEMFAKERIRPELLRTFAVPKVSFSYDTESWQPASFVLPAYGRDFVMLTPKDILTKDETWINRGDMFRDFDDIAAALPSESLRALINNYFRQQLPRNPKPKELIEAKERTIRAFPQLIEHYIKAKEDEGDKAESVSGLKVRETELFFIEQVKALVAALQQYTEFYSTLGSTVEEARMRVEFLKDVIENKDGYRFFWRDGQPIRKEEDLQILYRLTWCGTPSDINREVNNGRGPVDFKVSRGVRDKSLVECKLASNSKLKQNLQNQAPIYQKASDAPRALKVIMYFTTAELAKVEGVLKELKLADCKDIIVIDARRDNKPSASKA